MDIYRCWVLIGIAALLLMCSHLGMQTAKADDLPVSPYSAYFGSGIQRTMSLLAGSTIFKHNPVHILIYGQSITGQGFIERYLEPELKTRYPEARIFIENRSIGGYEASNLVRTSTQDIYPVYPDLVILHDYGGISSGELERIVSNIRRYTTSELVLLNHHYPRDINEGHNQDSRVIRELAAKYGFELVDIRDDWTTYLKDHNIQPGDLLQDSVHLNEKGGELFAKLVCRHFVYNPWIARPWYNTVRTYEARRPIEEAKDEILFTGENWKVENGGTVGSSPMSAMTLNFTGNRVDIISQPVSGKLGTAKIFIDGKAPSSFSTTWATTRSTTLPDWWFPCVNRVFLGDKPTAEEWTLNIHFNTEDGRDFVYDAVGSVTGKDGSGNSKTPFTSKSGKIRILPSDFSFAPVYDYRKVPMPKDLQVKFSVYCLAKDVFKPVISKDSNDVNLMTIVKLLPNGRHRLKIVPNGDGSVPIKEIIVHNPPMGN